MIGPMHYDDLAQLSHERQAALQREAQRWRQDTAGARQSQSEGETPRRSLALATPRPGRGPVGAYPPRRPGALRRPEPRPRARRG